MQSVSMTPGANPRTLSPQGQPTNAYPAPARAASLEQGALPGQPRGGSSQAPWLGRVEEDAGAPPGSSSVVPSQRQPRNAAGRVHSGPAMPISAARVDNPARRSTTAGTPGGVQTSRDSSTGGANQERLQLLRQGLSSFTNKMEEMRTVAETLQEEVLRESMLEAKPLSASSGTTTAPQVGPSGQASTSETSSLAESWVIDTLKKTLLAERPSASTGAATITGGDKELRLLRQEIRLESESQRQLAARLDATMAILQEEKKKREEAARQREEADAKLEQKWHGIVKEEGSLRRAVESHLEARLGALQREMRLECGAASQQAQQVLSEFSHLRETLRQEMELQKKEIGSASSDLSRLVDQLRVGGAVQPAAELRAGPESLTENLVRAEVRRQLSERPSATSNEAAPTVLEMQAVSSRLDRLEKSLENEAAGRQEENSKMINMFQEISAEARQHQDAMISELEQRLQGKLEQLSAEVQQEVTQRRTSLAKESKDREETAMAILKSLEDQLGSVEESLRRHEKELQRSLEATAAAFAEKNTKEMMTTRQDVLELREELQEVARTGRERLEEAVVRLNATAPARGDASVEVKAREELWTDLDQLRGELRVESATRKEDVQGVRSSLDRLREQVVGSSMFSVQELQNALNAERLAREQGDHLCQEALRELREDHGASVQGSPPVQSNGKDPSSPYADIKQVQPLPRPATSAVLGACRSPPSGLVLPTREATSAAPTAMNLSAVKTPSMTHPSFSA